LVAHRDDDGADAAGDVDLRLSAGVEAGFELSLRQDAFFGIADLDLAAVRMARQREIDAIL